MEENYVKKDPDDAGDVAISSVSSSADEKGAKDGEN